MSAARLLHTLQRIGAVVSIDDGDLVIDGVADLPTTLLADLKANKPELIALLLADAANDHSKGEAALPFSREPDPDALAEDWEERAAIIEADAGQTRRDAEMQAWRLVYCAACTHATVRGCRLKLAPLHCGGWHFTASI